MGAVQATDRSVFQMRSPINWAVLGLLIGRTTYGYDLVKRFERTYGDALDLNSPSQVYGALTALEGRGLIEHLPPEGPLPDAQRQLKLRYQATVQGRTSYQDWLITQVSQERQRSELFPRQLAELDPRAALAVLERYEEHLLQERRTAHNAPTLDGCTALARRLVAEKKRGEAGLALKWAAYARRELEATIDAQGPGR